jgi:predicted nucleic acid-binding protein
VNVVVSDSTTIIVLLKINRIDLLSNLFTSVYLPTAVYEEITVVEHHKFLKPPFVMHSIKNTTLFALLSRSLDSGESEAIVLAQELDTTLIIDEKKGRRIAAGMGINIVGLLGIVYMNVSDDFISVQEAKEIVETAQQAGLYLSERLKQDFFDALERIVSGGLSDRLTNPK